MKKIIIGTILLSSLSGCSSFPTIPQAEGEKNSGFTYIPLDPLKVNIQGGQNCYGEPDEQRVVRSNPLFKPKELLDVLPDNAVRVAIKEYNDKGKISFGPVSVGTEGKRYQVVLDYINVDTTNLPFFIKTDISGEVTIKDVTRTKNYYIDPNEELSEEAIDRIKGNIVIPVYVGVGLRLTADLHVISGKVNLSSLSSIASEVEAGNASGSLVVQTLGVTGKQVSTSLPLPSELNQTTVQNAILSLGAIKAIIYDTENTILTPRVTGMYLPIRNGDEELVNRIVSELAREPIPWIVDCVKIEDAST